jgi:hypothetical protein
MADELAYDLTGAWDLNYNADPSSNNLTTHQGLNFVRDGAVIAEGPLAFRAHFISQVEAPKGKQVTHAEVYTGLRYLDTLPGSPLFPCVAVAFYQADPGGSHPPYYSSWCGSVGVDRSDHLHPKYTNVVTGFLAGIEGDRGRFEMKRRG